MSEKFEWERELNDLLSGDQECRLAHHDFGTTKMPRLTELMSAATPARVPVESLVDSLFAILEVIDGWDEERLEQHRDRLEAAEEDLLGLIRVGECEHVAAPPGTLDNHWCGRDTLPGSKYCSRHQG